MSKGAQFDPIRRMFAAFDAKDPTTLADLVTDDVRLRLGNPPMVAGKRAFVAAVTAFLGSVTSFRHEILSVWHDGHTVIAELNVHYVRLDGGEVTLPCCNVFELRDELISDYRIYMDATPVYE